MTRMVPTQEDKIPAWPAKREGYDRKKCGCRRANPSTARSTSNAARVSIPAKVATRPSTAKSLSRFLLVATLFSISTGEGCGILVNLPEAFSEQVAADVKDQGYAHQRQTGGKNALIRNAAMGQIAQAYLHDIGGDRGRAFHWIQRQIRLGAGSDGNDHGLADGAREAQYVGGSNARERRWNEHSKRRLQASRPHRIRAFADVHRHGLHRVFTEGTYIRDNHHANDNAGAEHVEARQVRNKTLEHRSDKKQREITENHRWDGAQQL